jgi:hypothetical protein
MFEALFRLAPSLRNREPPQRHFTMLPGVTIRSMTLSSRKSHGRGFLQRSALQSAVLIIAMIAVAILSWWIF